jgi:hypothetical protein
MSEITINQLFDLMEQGEDTEFRRIEAEVVSKKGNKYQAKMYWKEQTLICEFVIC